jgi:hypothetical protein
MVRAQALYSVYIFETTGSAGHANSYTYSDHLQVAEVYSIFYPSWTEPGTGH